MACGRTGNRFQPTLSSDTHRTRSKNVEGTDEQPDSGDNSPERNDDSCQLLVADADAPRNDSATEQADHADPESCLAL